LVANSLSDVATVVDLSATPPGVVCVLGNSGLSNSCAPGAQVPPVSTGVQPSVAIYPRLNWAVVAPGGSGAVTIVDLGLPPTAVPVFAGRTPQVIATVGLVGTPQGIAVNPETGQSLIADPNNGFTELSLLNQTTSLLGLDKGEVADAINPLTNMAVSVNSLSNHAAVIDMQTLQPVLLQNQYIQTGLTPVSVDIDPVTNEAIVANSGAGANSVSVLSLGAIRPLHVIQSSPATTYTSSSALTLTVVGGGFDATSVVRLDQSNLITTVLPAGCTSNCRELTAAVPVAMLGSPRRFILDVLNQDTSTVSNVTDLTVMASVTVGTAPGAVAIDSDLGIAVVTNTGDGTINTINLTTSAVSAPIIVGSDPEGVAILPQSSEAVVTNFGSNNVSIINLILGTSVPLATGTGPLGVSINPDTNTAAVANNISNTLSLIDINIADTPAVTATINTDMNPLAVAIDPTLNYAAVTASGGNGTPTVVLYDLVNNSTVGRISGLSLPSGVVFDPVAGNFVIANSLQNNIVILVPTTLKTTSVSTGINPYSLDYNYQTSTLVTANSLSGTLSVMDYLAQQVEAVLPIGNSSMFSVAIDLLTNIAVVADQANNRVLLVPLPH
jgi:DNA-binding beta-propeller fold protein YncE